MVTGGYRGSGTKGETEGGKFIAWWPQGLTPTKSNARDLGPPMIATECLAMLKETPPSHRHSHASVTEIPLHRA